MFTVHCLTLKSLMEPTISMTKEWTTALPYLIGYLLDDDGLDGFPAGQFLASQAH